MNRGFQILLLWMLVMPSAVVVSAAAADSGTALPAVQPGPRDKCPICGMFVAKYPDWIAQIRYRDGTTVFFDGAKDFFKFYFQMEKYGLDRRSGEIKAIYATDYYTLTPIAARTAFYVVGSDVYGPMGRELIPFSDAETAQEFMRDHHGRQILRFDEVSQELIRTLD